MNQTIPDDQSGRTSTQVDQEPVASDAGHPTATSAGRLYSRPVLIELEVIAAGDLVSPDKTRWWVVESVAECEDIDDNSCTDCEGVLLLHPDAVGHGLQAWHVCESDNVWVRLAGEPRGYNP